MKGKNRTHWESDDDAKKRIDAKKSKKKKRSKEKCLADCGGIKFILLPPIVDEDKKENK